MRPGPCPLLNSLPKCLAGMKRFNRAYTNHTTRCISVLITSDCTLQLNFCETSNRNQANAPSIHPPRVDEAMVADYSTACSATPGSACSAAQPCMEALAAVVPPRSCYTALQCAVVEQLRLYPPALLTHFVP
jgi:hypothetical protein